MQALPKGGAEGEAMKPSHLAASVALALVALVVFAAYVTRGYPRVDPWR